ncbi:DPP10-like protein, partial [Mya arenaria]
IVVQNNNIYFKESVSEQRSGEPFLPVTSSGKVGDVFNGVPDWLYGEEVLRQDNTVWLSTNDKFLVYMEINDTGIPLIEMVHFSDPSNSYSEKKTLRYSKPGSPLPVLKLKVHNFSKNQTYVVPSPRPFLNRSPYVSSLVWKNNVTFAVTWLSVHHNVSIISICSASSGFCYDNILLQSQIGWIDPPVDIIFTPRGNEYFITIPRYDGTGNTYKQVAIVNASVEIN